MTLCALRRETKLLTGLTAVREFPFGAVVHCLDRMPVQALRVLVRYKVWKHIDKKSEIKGVRLQTCSV